MTEYARRFRYPGDVFEPERPEVEAALGLGDRCRPIGGTAGSGLTVALRGPLS